MASNNGKAPPWVIALILVVFGAVMIVGSFFTSRETRAFVAEAKVTDAAVTRTWEGHASLDSSPPLNVDYEFSAEGKSYQGSGHWGGTSTQWEKLVPADTIEIAYVLFDDGLNADSRLVTGGRLGFPWGFLIIGIIIFSGGLFAGYHAIRGPKKG